MQMRGVITKIIHAKGYGFIRDEKGALRFAHANEFRPMRAFDTAHEGQAVRFDPTDIGSDVKNRGNGLRAVNIEVLEVP